VRSPQRAGRSARRLPGSGPSWSSWCLATRLLTDVGVSTAAALASSSPSRGRRSNARSNGDIGAGRPSRRPRAGCWGVASVEGGHSGAARSTGISELVGGHRPSCCAGRAARRGAPPGGRVRRRCDWHLGSDRGAVAGRCSRAGWLPSAAGRVGRG